MKKTFLSVLALILLLTGFISGYSVGVMKVEKAKFMAAANAWQTAREKAVEAGVVVERTNSISGTVKEISGRDIVIEAQLVNPLQDESLKIRRVRVADNAQITIKEFKTPAKRKEYEDSVRSELEALKVDKARLVAEFESCGAVDGYKGPSLDDPKLNNEECKGLLREQSVLDDKIGAINNRISSEYWTSVGSLGDIKAGYMIRVIGGKDVNVAELAEFEAIALEAGAIPSQAEKGEISSLLNR